MKKHIYKILIPIVLLISACEKEEFLKFSQADSVIEFTGFPASSGNFTTLDEVVIPITAENASAIDVTTLIGGTATTFSQSASAASLTIQEPWTSLTGGVSLDSLSGDPIVIRVVATSNGEVSFKDFTLTYSNPISLDFSIDDDDFETASTNFPDSTFTIFYNASTINTAIAEIEFYAKVGDSSEYPTSPIAVEAIGGTSAVEQIQSINFPAEDSIDFDEDLFIKIVAKGANDLSDELELSVSSVEVPLNDDGEFVLFPDDFVAVAGVSDDPDTDEDEETPTVFDTENNGYDFSLDKLVLDSSDSADIRLNVEMGSLVLDLASGVEFVIADGNDAVVGFQSARDLFEAGTAGTDQITGLTELSADEGSFIILSIPDLAAFGTGSSEFVILRVDAVNLNSVIVDDDVDPINNSTVRLSFEARIP